MESNDEDVSRRLRKENVESTIYRFEAIRSDGERLENLQSKGLKFVIIRVKE